MTFADQQDQPVYTFCRECFATLKSTPSELGHLWIDANVSDCAPLRMTLHGNHVRVKEEPVLRLPRVLVILLVFIFWHAAAFFLDGSARRHPQWFLVV